MQETLRKLRTQHQGSGSLGSRRVRGVNVWAGGGPQLGSAGGGSRETGTGLSYCFYNSLLLGEFLCMCVLFQTYLLTGILK